MRNKIKIVFKYYIGFIRCFVLGGVQYASGIYIGRHVKFCNPANIKLYMNVQIRHDCDIFADDFIIIGNGSDIGARNRIAGNIYIGKKVLFGPNCHIASEGHKYTDPNLAIIDQGAYEMKKGSHVKLSIGDGSWIGANVAIIGCVHVGKHCVIGANSVITKDVPDYCVVVGNPARIIRRYDFNSKKWDRV